MKVDVITIIQSFFMSDEEVCQLVARSADAEATNKHSKEDLNFSEYLGDLSTALLDQILSYNEAVGNNMGLGLRLELRRYIELRRKPRKYLFWCFRYPERNHFARTELDR